MTKPLTYGSLFSGTECMSAAAIGLPLVPRFFAEVEPYPCAILRSKFPHVPNLGDVTKIKYDHETKTLTNGYDTVDLRDGLDILAGGSPCQDMSVAGKRAGADSHLLNDGGTTRSSLIFTYIRLIREIRPRWIIYENVPGLLTSNEGRDFAHFLVALAQCGYGDFAWRVLDAQYVRVDGMERAVPQRRRRVWLVGRLGANDGKSAEILLEPYGDPGDCPPRRKTREEIARSVAARAGLHGGVVARAGREGEVSAFNFELWATPSAETIGGICARRAADWMLAQKPASFDPYEPGGIKTVREDGAANTVVNGTCPGNHGAAVQRVTNSNGGDVAPTLSVTDLVKQTTGQADNGGGYVCATIENHQSEARVREADVAGTMGASRNAQAANNNPLVVATPAPDTFVKMRHARSAEDDERWAAESVAGTRNVHDGERPQEVVVEKPTPAVCIAENTIGRGERTGGNGVGAQEGVAYTLDTVAPHAVAYGINPQASLMHPCTEGVAQTLAVSHEGGVVQPRRSTCLTPGDPIQKRVYTADGPAPTLQSIAEGSGVSAQAFVLPQDADGLPEVVVRRLTPTECERLMGLPQQQYIRISDMNNDEFVAWEIGKGNISVDTENGIVYSNRRAQGIPCEPHELKGTIIRGYRHLKIVDGKVRRAVRHHRVVWIAAHGIPPEGMVVDHINNNKSDNRISNLQLLTPEDNSHKAHDDGLYLTGEDNPVAKLSDCEVEEVVLTYQLGYTMRQVARMFGISKSRVHQLVHQYGWTQVRFTKDQIADPALIAYFRRVHDDWQKMIAEDGKTPKPKTEAFVRDWLAKISDPATCPDAPRFKVCGNGMCANQVRWILLNLLHSEKINPWYGEDGKL